MLYKIENYGEHVVVWDGRDDNGYLLSRGIYVIYILISEEGTDIFEYKRRVDLIL